MPRPNQLKIKDVVEALTTTKGMVTLAADRLGVSVQTVYNYIHKNATVQEALNNARERQLDFTELKLYDAIRNGELSAIMFYLKTVGRQRGYVERLVIEGNIDVTLVNQTIRALEAAGMSASDIFHELIREAANRQTVSAEGDSQAAHDAGEG